MIEALLSGACLGDLWRNPMVHAVLGGSLHPGGPELTRDMLAAAALPRGARVAEVGCGTGTTTEILAENYEVTAFDPDPAMVARTARRVERATVRVGDAAALQGPYDAIVSECALCLDGDPGAALAAFHAALRPGGVLLLSDMNADGAFDGVPAAVACLENAQPHAHLVAAVERAGFTLQSQANRIDLVREVRDRIRARIDVEGVLGAAGATGLLAFVAACETALEEGRIGYSVLVASCSSDAA